MKTVLKSLLAVGLVASAVSADAIFDYSRMNQGTGFMAVDGAWQGCTETGYNCDFSYAKVEALHENGQWYTMGPGLPAQDTPGYQTCPNGAQEDGSSACYWGWNLDDGITDTGYTVRVTLGAYVNPTGWGYTNGGLIYILDGTQLATANYVNLGDGTITVKVWGEAGKPLKVYAMDQGYLEPAPGAEVGTMKCSFTGTGAWQPKTCRASDFSAYVGTTNVYTPSAVKAIAVEYEIAAGASGESFPTASAPTNATLSWQSLEGAPSAIGNKVAGQSVGFAALRNGLQFSNVGSATLNVQVFNTLGKVVASHKVTAKNSFVSTEGLGNGVYVVRATDGAKLNMMRNVTIMR